MTSAGMAGNDLSSGFSGSITGPFTYSGLASPFAQRGDFPFEGFGGAISDYHPDPTANSTYNSGVVRYVTASYSGGKQSDLFTSLDQHSTGKGTIVYLAGHDYSYNDNQGQTGITAGSRLVLNTLFSLGTNDVCAP